MRKPPKKRPAPSARGDVVVLKKDAARLFRELAARSAQVVGVERLRYDVVCRMALDALPSQDRLAVRNEVFR